MAPAHLDAEQLARALGVELTRIAPLVAEQGRMSSDLALRLARYFGTTPQFWLGLQTAHDLAVATAQFGAEIEARVQPIAA